MKDAMKGVLPLGMGCWAIGGPFYGDGQSLGWGEVDDAESIRTLHAAYDHGVRLFDTAAVYGAGHSERIVGDALKERSDCLIVTKLGLAFNENNKQVTGADTTPANVCLAIDSSLRRLQRDSIDLLLLHLNDLSVESAEPLFNEMEKARQDGKIQHFGWSTDYPDRVAVSSGYEHFIAVEHCMNVFVDTPTIQKTIAEHNLTALIRSPLAMGVLTGKYTNQTRFSSDDNRSRDEAWRDYFVGSAVDPVHLKNLDAVRECLSIGGRSLTQGALGWIMARSENNIPIPGARTPEQIIESAGAIEYGALPEETMAEIELLIDRRPEGQPRDR